MTAWMFALILAAPAALLIAVSVPRLRRDDLDGPAWIACGLAVFLLLAAVLTVAVIYPSRAVGTTTCRNFHAQTGYPTKFVVLNWADTGTCLAQTPDGHWTKNTNIIVNVPSRP